MELSRPYMDMYIALSSIKFYNYWKEFYFWKYIYIYTKKCDTFGPIGHIRKKDSPLSKILTFFNKNISHINTTFNFHGLSLTHDSHQIEKICTTQLGTHPHISKRGNDLYHLSGLYKLWKNPWFWGQITT